MIAEHIEKELQVGEELHVDTGCLVAFEPTIDLDIVRAGNIKTSFLGGEGFFLATLKGPGKVWLQSLPFSRLVGRIHAALPTPLSANDDSFGGTAAKVVTGGAILGGLGSIFGNNDES